MPRKLIEIFLEEIPKHYDRKKGLQTAAVASSSAVILVAEEPLLADVDHEKLKLSEVGRVLRCGTSHELGGTLRSGAAKSVARRCGTVAPDRGAAGEEPADPAELAVAYQLEMFDASLSGMAAVPNDQGSKDWFYFADMTRDLWLRCEQYREKIEAEVRETRIAMQAWRKQHDRIWLEQPRLRAGEVMRLAALEARRRHRPDDAGDDRPQPGA
jgi:hypothetical protein